jgi:hypothetical protein
MGSFELDLKSVDSMDLKLDVLSDHGSVRPLGKKSVVSMVGKTDWRSAAYLDLLQVEKSDPLSEMLSVETTVSPMENELVVKLVVSWESSSAFQKAKQKEMNSAVLSDDKSGNTKE